MIWTERSIWIWTLDATEPQRLVAVDEETLHWVERSGHQLILATDEGNIYRFDLTDHTLNRLHHGQDIAQDGVFVGDDVVEQLGLYEEDEDEDDEDDEDEDEDRDDHDEETWEEEDEDWDDDDEEDAETLEDDEGDQVSEFAVLYLKARVSESAYKRVGDPADSPIRSLHTLNNAALLCLRHDHSLERWDLSNHERTNTWTCPSALPLGDAPLLITDDVIVVWTIAGDLFVLEPSTLQARAHTSRVTTTWSRRSSPMANTN